MNRLSAFLTAIVAVVLMAGTSLAGGIEHGSWEAYTGMTGVTVTTDNQLVGVNVIDRSGKDKGTIREVNLNYETGEINYVIVGETTGREKSEGVTEEFYGVAPEWTESEKLSGTRAKDFEVTREMDMYF